jgi:STE24 endopeptidase
MNLYRLFIVAALLAKFLLDLVSEWLNLRALRPDLPAELQGFYDPQQYSKSQAYARAHSRLGIVQSIFDLAVLLTFWFAGGFNRLDQIVRGIHPNAIVAGILYIGIILLAGMALSLPFSIYSTFVIEEKFGFNRTTARTFAADRLKSLGLAAVLGIPLLAAILWFFQFAGNPAWLYCWVVSAAVTLILQFVAPVWILPLFNKFTPLAEGDLKERISQYAARAGLAFRGIFVMDGSKRSSKANAFFSGIGRNRRIALFDTLIEQHTVPELVAVLAHEIGHLKKRHILQGMAVGIAHAGAVFFLMSLFLNNRGLFDAFYVEQVSVYGSLLFFGLLYEPLSLVLSILLNAFSRKQEREADFYAARTIEDPEEMVTALKKLSVKNLSNLTPHPFYVFLHYSHPPLLQRIESIRANR